MKRLISFSSTAPFLIVAFILVSACLTPTAEATSTTFNFDGTLQSAINGTTSVTGTFTVLPDGTLSTYSFTDGSVTYSDGTGPLYIGISGLDVAYNMRYGPYYQMQLTFTHSDDYSSLTFDTPYGPSGFASIALQPGQFHETSSFFAYGSATPVSTTPEPASILLFSTGLAGIMLLLRKSLLA